MKKEPCVFFTFYHFEGFFYLEIQFDKVGNIEPFIV